MSSLNINWSSFIRWFVLTFLAVLVGTIIFVLVGIILGDSAETAPPLIFGVILGLIYGTFFGVAYYYFLKQYISDLIYWIPVTAITFATGAAIIFGYLDYEGLLIRLTHPVVVGLSLGIGQWLILRKNRIDMSQMWILFSIVGWILGELIGIITENFFENPLPLLLTFMVGGSSTGMGMIWILKQQSGYMHQSTKNQSEEVTV